MIFNIIYIIFNTSAQFILYDIFLMMIYIETLLQELYFIKYTIIA